MPDSEDKTPAIPAKNAWKTFVDYVTLHKTVEDQNVALKELANEVVRLSDRVINLSEKVTRLETQVEESRKQNEVETKRIISEFIRDFRDEVRQSQMKAMEEENAMLRKLLEAKTSHGS